MISDGDEPSCNDRNFCVPLVEDRQRKAVPKTNVRSVTSLPLRIRPSIPASGHGAASMKGVTAD